MNYTINISNVVQLPNARMISRLFMSEAVYVSRLFTTNRSRSSFRCMFPKLQPVAIDATCLILNNNNNNNTRFPAHQGKLFYFYREKSGNLRKMPQIREKLGNFDWLVSASCVSTKPGNQGPFSRSGTIRAFSDQGKHVKIVMEF